MSYNWHSEDFNQKLREHERYLDNLMDHHNGEEPEYDPEDYIDDDHPKLRRLRGEVEWADTQDYLPTMIATMHRLYLTCWSITLVVGYMVY